MVQARLSPWLDMLLVAIFLLAIGVPFVATAAGIGGEETDEEIRTAAPAPAPPHDLVSLAAWPEAFTKYFADHFAFRARLVRWQARLRVGILGASPTPDVLIGHNGWLFYGTDGAIEDFTGTRPFTIPELEALAPDAPTHAGLARAARHRLRLRPRPGQALDLPGSACPTALNRRAGLGPRRSAGRLPAHQFHCPRRRRARGDGRIGSR